MQRLGMEEDEPIEHGMVTRAIERAQKQVEDQNFSMRKHLLEYDDVMNKQREAFYELRRDVLEGRSQRDYVLEVAAERLDRDPHRDRAGGQGFRSRGADHRRARPVRDRSGRPARGDRPLRARRPAEARETLLQMIRQKYERKESDLEAIAAGVMRKWEQELILFVADGAWRDHLYALDHLKEGIGLRGYAQRDPLVEYKRESFDMFEGMWQTIEEEIVLRIFLFKPGCSRRSRRGPAPAAPRRGRWRARS